MNISKSITVSALALTLFHISSLAQKNISKPNIIVIMCDDLGYGDLSCYGQKRFTTPNIDKLASEGMRFTQAYAGSPVSAPSRATFMTGQHTGHTEVRGNKEYWRKSQQIRYGNNLEYAVTGQHPYDTNHIILPEIFKDNGYSTGMFGKWAGGYEGSVSTPDKRGIDEFYGYICQYMAHLYYPNFLNSYSRSEGDTCVRRDILSENIKYPMSGDDYNKRAQYSAEIIHNKAVNWIKKQDKDTPFFGLFTYTLPHAELVQPNDELLKSCKKQFFVDKTWGGLPNNRYNATTNTHAQFSAMVKRLDLYVGEILSTLKEKGFDDNTIVIFTSDNGPHEEGGADPEFFMHDGSLKGLKRQCYEGGIRIPFIVRYPIVIKSGTETDHQIAFYDIMPTFCDIIGLHNYKKKYKKSDKDYFDGISFMPTLTGQHKQTNHKYLYWEFHETDQIALRCGDWKLIVIKGIPHLYNLKNDFHEDNDLASSNTEMVKKMIEIINREHLNSNLFKVTLPN